ncbi:MULTISPECIES: hypothetical protein [unclassified Acidovorax]|uniref:hypothetical protein n=1 Tax=unclassified Acidovorax TaxID=2684926 RepID=UPI0006FADF7F|nr:MULTISPECIES: hypothetical protein [unclassified Acidovorax]KRB28760.1 hypothetical protein ASD94_07410 [Acidovorax sp. Root70]PUA96950.1 hypothetical protein C8C99_1796 [Acidovorax sp. 107]
MVSLQRALLAGTKVSALLVLALAGQGGEAAGGTGAYPLDWGRAGETLQYRSCGCADRCWMAEVKHLRSRKTLASLRCDCERLFARVGNSGPEVEHSPSCSTIDDADNKPRAIREALEQMLGR